jgi:acyl carrier protein
MSEAELKDILLDGLLKISPEADPATLRVDQNIRETLDIDSFDFLSFLIALHDRLGVEIPEADYGKLSTLDAMLRYLGPKV